MEAHADPVMEELEALEKLFLEAAESFRKKKEVLKRIKTMARSRRGQGAASSSVTPLPQETAVLSRLRKTVEDQLSQLKKNFHSELDQLASWNYDMDISSLFASRVGEVIRSFHTVTPEMLRTALDAFIAGGREDDLRLLLFVGADLDGLHDGETALIRAVSAGHMGAVEMLAEAGAGLDVKGTVNIGGLSGLTALHVCCCFHRLEIGTYLLSRGANADAAAEQGARPLHSGTRQGLTNLVVSLFDHGAEIDAKKGPAGFTALQLAVMYSQRATAQVLLDKGAAVNIISNNYTPLSLTAVPVNKQPHDNADMARLLLS